MNHKQADKLMKEVMEYHLGDFTVNGDVAYSSSIANRILEKNTRRYSGVDTCFDGRNMYGTGECERINGSFTVHPGGIVYGPYYSFEKGTYKAGFFIQGNADQCTLSVESSGRMFVSCPAEQVKRDDGIYILEFELTEKTDNIEIKLANNGTETVVFEKVILKIGCEEIITNVISHEAPVAVAQHPEWVAKLEELDLAQSQLTDRMVEVESTSDCALPLDTKYRLIKRIVRKVIKCYWRYQTVFNSLVAQQYRALTDQMQRVVNSCHQIWQMLSAQSERLADMESRLEDSEKSAAEFKEALAEQTAQMLAYQRRNATVLAKLHDELDDLEEKLSLIEGNAKAEKADIQNALLQIKGQAESDKSELQSRMYQMEEKAESDKSEFQSRVYQIEQQTAADQSAWQTENANQAALIAQLQSAIKNLEERLLVAEDSGLSNDAALKDGMQKAESQFAKITECAGVLQQSNEAIGKNAQEIGYLWAKIREFDTNFQNEWNLNREMNEQFGNLWSAQRTMRQEIFYEIDSRSRTFEKAEIADPVILESAKEKIQLANGAIRLNLGSGNLPKNGYLNVDARNLSNVDIVADISNLPYQKGSVDEIFSAHLIEHFTRQRMEREILPYWYSLIKDGGSFGVVFPDLSAMIQAYRANEMTFDSLAEVIMGGQDYQMDYHYAVYSPKTVMDMLEKVGFKNIWIVAEGRENGECRETEIRAEK